jgi:small-conductance mechanosensitive channel
MRKIGWVVVTVFVVALAGTVTLYAQARAAQGAVQVATAGPVQVAQVPGEGARERWSQMSEADRAKMREQMQERRLEEAGLADKEKAAAKKLLKAREAARTTLAAELVKLQRAANKSKPTDKQLSDALSAYRAALAQYRRNVAAEDAALVKQLSLKSQVRCMSLGILDNGLGFGGGRMAMGGGMRGPGGLGGGRPRGF